MKTDKNTLIDVIRQDCKDHSASTMGNGRDVYVREDLAIQAMQSYAKQDAIRFHMFMVNRKGEHHEAAYNDLYQLYLNQKNQK